MKKLLFSCIGLLALSVGAIAQATATATVSATVITPISITNTANMNFGNVAVSATTAGTVLLTPAGGRTAGGGVTLPAATGTVTAASFTVNGSGSSTYAITLPSAAVTLTSGAATMTATLFTSNPSGTGTLASGAQTLNVGATLNVAAGQTAGSYTSGTFDVTVNYN